MNHRKPILQYAAAGILLVLFAIPMKGKAGSLRSAYLMTDTIPAPVQQLPSETEKNQPVSAPVKEEVKKVPKSRKQVKPVAVPPVGVKVPVKPIIVKPQIRRVTGLIP